MVHITADRHRCVGAGQCVLSAARVFDQDAEGLVVVHDAEPVESERPAVAQAVDLCPSSAIWLRED